MDTKLKTMVVILAGSAVAALGSAYLLTGIAGPTDQGLSCVRSPVPECRVLQTRFFGIFGNSYFALPESAIHGAKTLLPLPTHVGGRGGSTFTVALVLDPEMKYPLYPVLSYALQSQADASTRRLNEYFSEKTIPGIEITDDLLTPLLLKGGVPLLIVSTALAVRWWRFRRRPAPT